MWLCYRLLSVVCSENVQKFIKGAKRCGVRGAVIMFAQFDRKKTFHRLQLDTYAITPSGSAFHCALPGVTSKMVLNPPHPLLTLCLDECLFEADDLIERRNDWKVQSAFDMHAHVGMSVHVSLAACISRR